MSLREISIAVRAENRTMGVFRTISSDIMHLGMAFGALDSQTGRMVMQVFSVVRLMTSLKAILATTTAAQTAQNAAVATGAGAQAALATSTVGAAAAQTAQNTATKTGIISQALHAAKLGVSAAAHGVYSAACWVATAAQNALNISYATFLALTGVGIAVIVAAAAAMAYFASQMNSATASVQSFNAAAEGTVTRGRSIRRAGEEDFYRRGVE